MEDLLAFAELFGLKVLGENTDPLLMMNMLGAIPHIIVEGEDGLVQIELEHPRGKLNATGRIKGVPMLYIGCGSRLYSIDI